MRVIRAGTLRHRVSVQAKVKATAYATGTVAVENGETAIIPSASWPVTLAGRRIYVAGDSDYYTLARGAGWTLDRAFAGATNPVATFTVMATDSHGGDVYEWATVTTATLRIWALRGRELETAQQRWAEAEFGAEGYYRDGVFLPERRLLWGSRALDIGFAEDPDGYRRRILIYAKEVR